MFSITQNFKVLSIGLKIKFCANMASNDFQCKNVYRFKINSYLVNEVSVCTPSFLLALKTSCHN